ncbi:MAG: acyl-CoA dehydrogenase family protein, partial [Novosphingobium sp.]
MNLQALLEAAETYRETARAALAQRLANRAIDQEQRAAHGFAWIATSVASLEAVLKWAEAGGGTNPLDAKVAQLAFAETLGQLTGGLPMGPGETFRPADLGISAAALAEAAAPLLQSDLAETRAALAAALGEGQWPSETLHDAELDEIRAQFRRFTDAEILPHAHGWHLANALIPEATVQAMADLGTFGVCIPEEYGGLGLGKLVMCLVSEELSRGWIGAGS